MKIGRIGYGVNERTVRLCRTYLGKTNKVAQENWCLVVESPYAKEEDLVCEVLVEFLYKHYYKKGIYAYRQDMLIDLFGKEIFNLLRYNYAIEYGGELNGQKMWIL